jgi:uncharacterized Tic20 family protein
MASKSKSTENLELVGHFVHLTGIFLSFLGPLILYLMYKDKANDFVKSNIIEALNFQLTGLVALIVCIIIPILGWFLLLPIVSLILIILPILATIESANDRKYKYPIKIEFIK